MADDIIICSVCRRRTRRVSAPGPPRCGRCATATDDATRQRRVQQLIIAIASRPDCYRHGLRWQDADRQNPCGAPADIVGYAFAMAMSAAGRQPEPPAGDAGRPTYTALNQSPIAATNENIVHYAAEYLLLAPDSPALRQLADAPADTAADAIAILRRLVHERDPER